MQANHRCSPSTLTGQVLEQVILLQILEEDGPQAWPRAELESKLRGEPLAINDALEHLREEGAIELKGELVYASRCARYLDQLDLIAA